SVRKYLRAIGGETAHKKLISRVMKGKFEIPEEGVIGSIEHEAMAPDRLRVTLKAQTKNGQRFESLTVFDGAAGWEFYPTNDGRRELTGEELTAIKRDAEFYREIELKEHYPKMKLKGKERVGKRAAYVVEATPREGNPEKLYFNAQTGLLIRIVDANNDVYFDEYREVDEVKLPFTVHISSPAAGKFIARFDEIRHNIPIEEAQFKNHDPALTAVATDEYIVDEMKKRRIPGLALVAIKNGEIVKMHGYGVANLEHDVAVTPDTVFALASVTKQFTATAIMRLVEQGLLKPDDQINRYLPRSPKKWRGITVSHLLTHTAGMVGHYDDGFFLALSEKTDVTTAEDFQAIAREQICFKPGESFHYSDAGYFLLGMIIEKVSGQSYRHFMAEQFFGPLGMTSTSTLDQWAIVKHRAANYTIRDGQVINSRWVWQEELPSHWGIFSTVRDLAKWDQALAAGKVVKESTLNEMWTPVSLNNGQSYPYGYGWEVERMDGRRIITHPGLSGTEYTILPDDKLTIVVLTNLGDYLDFNEIGSWGLTRGIARRYLSGLT
ncbi:MAG: serine hydrolase, partial [Acidobacteria bacterium]|nr:serine hydrolase [Acidobacteriota bacterium]